MIAYLIFVASTMAAVTEEISRRMWVIICTPFLAGMVCLNDFSWLSFMSVGAILGVVISFATVYAYGKHVCGCGVGRETGGGREKSEALCSAPTRVRWPRLWLRRA